MLGKMLRLLYFLSVIVLINPLQSNKQPKTKQYHSLYSNDASGRELTNIFETGTGVLKFLQQDQRYLNQEIPETDPQFGAVYDFIIIGAGTTGATIAARLIEISQIEVLLIEAGSSKTLAMDIPVFSQFCS